MYEEFFVPALFERCARELVDLVELRPGETVLDLACGTGVVARQAAAAVGDGGHVVGLDLRPGMLAVASSLPTRPRIEWVEGDALALPFPEASFDVVLPAGPAVLRRNRFMRELSEIEARHLEAVGLSFEDVAAPILLARHREGGEIVVPMHVNLAAATAAG